MCMSVSTDAIRPLALNTDCQAKRVDLYGKVLIYKCCCCYWFNSVTNQSHRFQLTSTGIRNPFNLHNARIYLKEWWIFDESLGNYKEVGLTRTDMEKESGFRSGVAHYVFDEFVLLSFGILTCMNHSQQDQKHALTSVDFMTQLMQDILYGRYIYPPRNKT